MITLAKEAFYKFYFFLGLITAAYYAYGLVQDWGSAGNSAEKNVSSNQVILQKVDALTASQENNAAPHRRSRKLFKETSSVAANTNVTETVATTTSGTEGEKPAEATADPATAQNPEATEQQLAINPEVVPGYPYPVDPNAASVAQPSDSSAASSTDPNMAALTATTAFNQPSRDTPTAGYSAVHKSTIPESYSVTASDMQKILLPTNAPKGIFANQTPLVAGTLYNWSGSVFNPTPVNSIAINTQRWAKDQGVKPDIAISFTPAAGSIPMAVNVTFKMQDPALNETQVSFSAAIIPTAVVVSGDRNTYTFTLPNTPLGADPLTDIELKLVYSGNVLTPNSELTFKRANVNMTTLPWNSTAPNTPYGATDPYLIATSVYYKVDVQKL